MKQTESTASTLLRTKKELDAEGLLYSPPYSVMAQVYIAMHNDRMETVHIPHSDVYFVRTALEKRTGYWFPLDVVEYAMKQEGWNDRKGASRFSISE
jgi:hypothetical protein